MFAYIGRRIIQAIPVLIIVTLVAFALIHLIPGDPVKIMLSSRATPEAIKTVRHQLGLDRPLPIQYLRFLAGAIRMKFGNSLFLRTSIGPIIAKRATTSIALLVYSVLVSLVIAVPLAIISAVKRNRPTDHIVRMFSTFAFAMPAFWTGLLLVLFFALRLKLFPTSGVGEGPIDYIRSLTLPSITIGFYLAPVLLRSLRASVIETLT
ncbi:MAG: hypothetical protein AMS17_17030, partial [Spirochaetes bacterium DG_61]